MRSEELGLGLCVVEGEQRFWDYAKQELLRTRAELAVAGTAAEQRAAAAEWRAAAALEISRFKALIAQMEPKPCGPSQFVGESV